MSQEKERNLTVIETEKTDTKREVKTVDSNGFHSNPIAKKFLDFHNEKTHKFSVRDLFKK